VKQKHAELLGRFHAAGLDCKYKCSPITVARCASGTCVPAAL
jgi:hypothetical protein